MKGLAINVGANSNLPGFRGPIYSDGSFEYIPIPEREETWWSPPSYGELGIDYSLIEEVRDVEVHLDPQFMEYPCCHDYIYGDEHGVKSGPISRLDTDDYLFFYATLDRVDNRGWGVYLIGHFKLRDEPLMVSDHCDVPWEYRCNAHYFRKEFDADVVVLGNRGESVLYSEGIELSDGNGSDPGEIVAELSSDSGRGPWWRRPMWFREDSLMELFKHYIDI